MSEIPEVHLGLRVALLLVVGIFTATAVAGGAIPRPGPAFSRGRSRSHRSRSADPAPVSPEQKCTPVPVGVEKFLRAQTGFPSNLRQFFPPVLDVLGYQTTTTDVFALADIHGAMDAWVQQQIECECGGNKDSAGCRYKAWKPWKLVEGTVESCGTQGGEREEIRVKIRAENVLVFAQSIRSLSANGFNYKATDTTFGEKLASESPVDPRKWVFGESDFEWTFHKATDVDMGLVNYYLKAREPTPNSDPNKWTPLNLTPYQTSVRVTAKSGSECLSVQLTSSDQDYLGASELFRGAGVRITAC